MSEHALDLDAIEKRANAATPGPWTLPEGVEDEGYGAFVSVLGATGQGTKECCVATCAGVFTGSFEQNAEFIAHARTDVPALCARVREQVTAIARLEAENERHRRANLVRAVVDGYDEWITEAINAEDWDGVPWRVADELKTRLSERDATITELRAALRWADVFQVALDAIAEGRITLTDGNILRHALQDFVKEARAALSSSANSPATAEQELVVCDISPATPHHPGSKSFPCKNPRAASTPEHAEDAE